MVRVYLSKHGFQSGSTSQTGTRGEAFIEQRGSKAWKWSDWLKLKWLPSWLLVIGCPHWLWLRFWLVCAGFSQPCRWTFRSMRWNASGWEDAHLSTVGAPRLCPKAGTGAKSLHPRPVLPQLGGMASWEHYCFHVLMHFPWSGMCSGRSLGPVAQSVCSHPPSSYPPGLEFSPSASLLTSQYTLLLDPSAQTLPPSSYYFQKTLEVERNLIGNNKAFYF